MGITKKEKIFNKFNGKCCICGVELVKFHKNMGEDYKRMFTIDHIKPISLGGSNDIDNLRPMCQRCNSIRNNKAGERRIKIIKDRKYIKDYEMKFIIDDICNGLITESDIQELKEELLNIYEDTLNKIDTLSVNLFK